MLISSSSFNSTKKRFAFHFSHRYTGKSCSISQRYTGKSQYFPVFRADIMGKVLSANGFLLVVHKVLGKWSMREMNLRILGFISNIFGSIYNVFWLKSPVEKPIQIFSLAVDIFSNISLIHFIYCDRQYWKEMRTIW